MIEAEVNRFANPRLAALLASAAPAPIPDPNEQPQPDPPNPNPNGDDNRRQQPTVSTRKEDLFFFCLFLTVIRLCFVPVVGAELLRGRWFLQRPNLALAAAALSPAYGHMQFVAPEVRDQVWNELAVWATEFPAKPQARQASQAGLPLLPEGPRPTLQQYKDLFAYARRALEANAPADVYDLRLPAAGEPDKFDALSYWQEASRMHGDFQKITHVVRLVLSVPASSAPSERVFSIANLIVTQLRNQLQEYKVEQLTIIRHHAAQVGAPHLLDFVSQEIARLVKAESDRREREKKEREQKAAAAKKRAAGDAGIDPHDPRRQSAPASLSAQAGAASAASGAAASGVQG